MIDVLLWIGIAAMSINFILQFGKMLHATRRLESYLADKYPREYEHIYVDGWVAKAFLWPFMRRPNVVDFIFKSREDFGDDKLRVMKGHLRQAFALMLTTMAALAAWSIVLGLVVPMILNG
jgi:hypothetical protein